MVCACLMAAKVVADQLMAPKLCAYAVNDGVLAWPMMSL